jgi:hypothetical protein
VAVDEGMIRLRLGTAADREFLRRLHREVGKGMEELFATHYVEIAADWKRGACVSGLAESMRSNGEPISRSVSSAWQVLPRLLTERGGRRLRVIVSVET